MAADINLTPTCSYFQIGHGSGALPARSWGSPADCKAAALLVHGLGAHSGWFEAFARQLKVRRIYSISFDLAGFGKRNTQYVDDASLWVDEIIFAYDYLRRQVKDKPIYVVGNSVGALLAVAAVEYMRPDGLILLSPGFQGHPETFTKFFQIQAIIKAYLVPEMLVPLPYTPDMVSRDPSSVQFMENDSTKRFSVPGKMLLELLDLSNRTMKWLRHIDTFPAPVLMLTAGQDQIVDNSASDKIFKRINPSYKQAHTFEYAWHDLMFDPVVDEVADWLVRWQAYLPGKDGRSSAKDGSGSR